MDPNIHIAFQEAHLSGDVLTEIAPDDELEALFEATFTFYQVSKEETLPTYKYVKWNASEQFVKYYPRYILRHKASYGPLIKHGDNDLFCWRCIHRFPHYERK